MYGPPSSMRSELRSASVVDSGGSMSVDRLPSPGSSVPGGAGAADPRRPRRRIVADDSNWTLATVPDLVELTIRHIVTNFASQLTQFTTHLQQLFVLADGAYATLVRPSVRLSVCCLSVCNVCIVAKRGTSYRKTV